ncbi:DNA primase [Nocardiopsis sp. CNT-189]|uniref:DNA primase n=1 Tax=Nocardiopsis oceanisediminis TaxID=2816862 RepID=UPI003B29131F
MPRPRLALLRRLAAAGAIASFIVLSGTACDLTGGGDDSSQEEGGDEDGGDEEDGDDGDD